MAHLISPNRHARPFGVVFVALHARQYALQIGAGQVRASQVGPRQVGAAQIGPRQPGTSQVGVGQPCEAQIGPRQVGAGEVCASQVAPAKIGPAGHYSAVADVRDRRQRRGGVRLAAFAQKRRIVSERHADGQRLDNRLRQTLVVWHEGVNIVDQAQPPRGDARAIVEVRTCGGLGHFSTTLCGGI